MPTDPQSISAEQRPTPVAPTKPAVAIKATDVKTEVEETPAAVATVQEDTTPAPEGAAAATENAAPAVAKPQTVVPRRSQDGEIRVSTLGRLANYVATAATLFLTDGRNDVTLKATGNAIGSAINLAELLKRRIQGLHQITLCGSTAIPRPTAGPNGEPVTRNVSYIEIKLCRNATCTDVQAAGYQEPLDSALVKELPPEEIAARRGRGRPSQRGRYRGNRYGRPRRGDGPGQNQVDGPRRRGARGGFRGGRGGYRRRGVYGGRPQRGAPRKNNQSQYVRSAQQPKPQSQRENVSAQGVPQQTAPVAVKSDAPVPQQTATTVTAASPAPQQ